MMLVTEAPDLPGSLDLGALGLATVDGEVLASVADQPAGAWLAVLLEQVDPAGLASVELPGYLQAWQRLLHYAQARIAAGMLELSARADSPCTDKEMAVALREPPGAVPRRLWAAGQARRRLPKVWASFGRGELSDKHLEEVVRATARTDDVQILDVVTDRLLTLAGTKTPRELGRYARDLIRRLDPEGAQQRARDARAKADVVAYPADDDGMSDLVATMGVEDAAIVKAGVDAYAITAKQTGDPRNLGMLRAEGLTRLAAAYLTGDSGLGSPPRSGGRPIEIAVTCSLRTALGLDDLPGELPGHGLVPRDVIAELIGREQPTLRLLVIDETTGRLLHRGTDSYRPTAAQIAQVRATYPHSAGPGSTIPASRCDLDHVTPYPAGPTAIGNLVPLDRSWHRAKTHHGLKVSLDDTGTITVTTPLGQTRTVEPHDHRTTPTPTAADVQNLNVNDATAQDDEVPPF